MNDNLQPQRPNVAEVAQWYWQPTVVPKVLWSGPGLSGYLSPLSKVVYSDTSSLPEEPMAYKRDWWLNCKKKRISNNIVKMQLLLKFGTNGPYIPI